MEITSDVYHCYDTIFHLICLSYFSRSFYLNKRIKADRITTLHLKKKNYISFSMLTRITKISHSHFLSIRKSSNNKKLFILFLAEQKVCSKGYKVRRRWTGTINLYTFHYIVRTNQNGAYIIIKHLYL